jgi:predicted AAA+ superfamily ATPase
MLPRLIKPAKSQSFFLFGARGTGKSTYIRNQWNQPHHYINLLLDRWETRYRQNPDRLISDFKAIQPRPEWIVIDEIQKLPKLLDIVHELIESFRVKFVLTGSSARKLKKSAANLLAGRAFHMNFFPLTYRELGKSFDLDFVLNWGSLPMVFSLNESDRTEYIRSYAITYLKEEILQEQLVRNSVGFRNFLEIAAQSNGKALNFSKIAADTGVDTKTAQSFFQILEDTLVGTIVPAYTRSARKSVKLRPKFYLFDLGIKRAMELTLESKIVPRTAAYGAAFEHFVILETLRLNSYTKSDFQIFHYQTTAGGEIDLILRKGNTIHAVEIKSSMRIDEVEVRRLAKVADALSPSKVHYVSQDPVQSRIEGVECKPWQSFMDELF